MGATIFETNLTKSNLSKTNLFKSIFFWSKLIDANLSSAELSGATFEKMDMFNANLSEANLTGSNFTGVNLSRTNLNGCDLTGTKFHLCLFAETNIEGAYLSRTVFADCDLRGLVGLKNVIHDGPSTVGIDTLLLSEGDIPPEFLRGCGLPDHVIEYVKTLATKPIQYYTCFISHSSKDEPFPKHLYDKLQGADVRCWYFPEHARTGEKLRDEIDRAIRYYDKLVVICSANSLSSQPVVDEIQEALKQEREEIFRSHQDWERVNKGELDREDFEKRRYRKCILSPIMIDDYLLKEWKHPLQSELKNRVVADFRGWDNFDKFDKEFKKLLKDLNARE